MVAGDNRHVLGLSNFVVVMCMIAALPGVFLAGLWAYAGLGMGLILCAALWIKDKQVPWPDPALACCALIALGLMAIDNLQSLSMSVSWREWIKLVTIFLPLLVLTSPHLQTRLLHPEFFSFLLIAAMTGALALSVELELGGPLLQAVLGPHAPLSHYNRGLSFLVVFSFPLMAGLMYGRFPLTLSKRLWIVVPFFVMLLIPAGLTESRAAKLALLSGLMTLIAALVLPVLMRRLLVALTVCCIVWPFAAQALFTTHYDLLSHIPDSWHARIEIWDYMSYRILDRPFLGWGLGTAHLLSFHEPHGAQYIYPLPASHPHNVMTQLWVELGVPGVALGIVFAFMTLRKAGQLDPKLVPYALGAWMAAFCLSLVAYDFWTDSLFSTFALCGFVFAMLNKTRKTGSATA